MSMLSRMLSRAIQLSQTGQAGDARNLLRAILNQDPHHEAAWFHYVRLLPTAGERVAALERFLQIEPGNPWAQRELQALQQERRPVVERERRPARYQTGFLGLVAVLSCGLAGLLLAVFYVRVGILDREADRYARLESAHDDLQGAYDGLQRGYEDLEGEYDTLQGQYDTLQGQHEALQAEYLGLQDEHQALQEDYDFLFEQYGELASLSITPPYIFVHNQEVEIAFERVDGLPEFWTVPFESLEWSILAGDRQRRDPDWLRLKVDSTGEVRRVQDYERYVNPDPFAAVMATMYQEAESDEAFIREAWHLVTQLSPYADEEEDKPRYPLETLLAGGGDCEDTSILLASMLKAAPVDWKIELVYMDAEHLEAPEEVNHLAVKVTTGSDSYLIETTDAREMTPYGPVRGWFFEVD